MAQPRSKTVAELKPREFDLQGYQAEPSTDGIVEFTDLTHGMYTAIPRAQRPLGSSILITNGRIRDNWVGRRGDYPNFITKPNSNDIIRIISFHGEQNQDWIVRVANGSIHATSTTSAWSALSGSSYSSFSRVDYAQLLGNLYLSNLTKKIVKVDLSGLTFAEISDSNAATAKYITSFAERIVAAYISDPVDGILPYGLKWCVNANPDDWTSTGSGSENLIQSPSDTGDEITGLFAFSNIMVIMRERSIWHASRQPFSTAPFRFDPIITNVGCDMPHTIQRVSDEGGRPTGLIFADNRTKGVYYYSPGSRPVRLPGSDRIRDRLFDGIDDPENAVAAFDNLEMEYHIGIPTDSGNPEHLKKFWVFNVHNGSVVEDDGPECTSIDVVSDIGSPVVIDDLTGVIDSLTGTIDDLGGGNIVHNPIVVKGNTVGQSVVEDLASTGTHTFTWTSQDLGAVSRRRVIKALIASISATSANAATIQWSKDNVTWTTIKTIADVSALNKIGFKSQVGSAGDHMYIRITSVAAKFRMTELWMQIMDLGETHVT